jgi:hypothetical protein
MNLERAGISRSVAMKLTGHKTEAVYRRYAIVAESDLREAGIIRAQREDFTLLTNVLTPRLRYARWRPFACRGARSVTVPVTTIGCASAPLPALKLVAETS